MQSKKEEYFKTFLIFQLYLNNLILVCYFKMSYRYSMHKKTPVWCLKYVLCINSMHLSSVTSFTVKFLIGTLLKIHRHSFHKKQFLSLAEWVFYSKASSQSRKHMIFVSFKNQWRLSCCNRVGSCSFVSCFEVFFCMTKLPLCKN